MSHIAEGLLHAHLDGALDPAEREGWAEAEAHLAVCEDCRRRLDEARAIRDRVTVLLAGAVAPAPERPSFDALRTAAGGRQASRPYRWWRSPVRLAWAASLVLAVGAGWIGRQLLVEQRGDVVLRQERRATPQRPGPAELVQPRAAEPLDDRSMDGAAGTEEGAENTGRQEAEAAGARAAVPDAEEAEVDAAFEARRKTRGDVAAAPQSIAAASGGESCYGIVAAEAPAGMLRLRVDGTATLSGDGRPLVGFWVRPSEDSVTARLTDGQVWYEVGLGAAELEKSARDCPGG